VTPKRIIIYLLICVTVSVSVLLGGAAWVTRDGLGPDMVDSNGSQAFIQFIQAIWPILLACVLILFGLVKLLKTTTPNKV